MPQDSLRSVVYRSFVTCDDPKGVAECKTKRKSKTESHKVKNKNNSTMSSSLEEERKEKFGKGSIEDVKIMEVSRGAEKLNEVIDSWSNNRKSFDMQSECIAKDLLKGALDLQESLVMLGKLQEISQHKVRTKRREKEKAVGEKVNVGYEFLVSDPYGEYNVATAFQKPRSSTASSRDCYEELRDVIVESFGRHNLLPKSSLYEDTYLQRKSVDLSIDVASSSSSHSSLVRSRSSGCSPSKEKSKGSSLIAKLMGLEELHSEKIDSKQMDNKGCSRYLLDIDLPRSRKPHFMVQKQAQERRTLEDMIETMQFKGLVGHENVDESEDGEYHSNILFPPIVIMKPLHVVDLGTKELRADKSLNEEKKSVKSKQVPGKIKEVFPVNSTEVQGGRLLRPATNEKSPTGRPPKQKFEDKRVQNSGDSPARQPKMNISVHGDKSGLRMKNSKPPSPIMQHKEIVVKMIDDIPKTTSSTRKHGEKKAQKSQESIKTQKPGKTAISKLTKPVIQSDAPKSRIAQRKHTSTSKQTTPKTALQSNTLKKNLAKGNPDSNLSAALVETIPNDNNLHMSFPRDVQGPMIEDLTSEQIPAEVIDDAYDLVSDSNEFVESCSSEPSYQTIEHNKDLGGIPFHDIDEKVSESITNTRCLLSCSASFLSHVNNLFDTRTDDLTTSSATSLLSGCEPTGTSLLLECAKEILERKSLRSTRIKTYPLSQYYLSEKPKCHLSLDQLITEISDSIEDLRSYSKSDGGNVQADSIYSMLKKDVQWKGEVTGAWDLGWINGRTMEEVDEVAVEVQNILYSEIVDEIVREIIFW